MKKLSIVFYTCLLLLVAGCASNQPQLYKGVISPSGGSGIPNGAPPQIVGYKSTNIGESDTLSGNGGDCPTATFARTGTGAYGLTLTCTKTNGTAFTSAATGNASGLSSGTLASTLLPAPFTSGTRTGNTSKFLTGNGTYTTGDVYQVDANGNAVDAGIGPGITGSVFAIGFNFIGTPTASMVESVTCPAGLNFPSGLVSPTTFVTCGTNPSESDTYTLQVAGATKATIAISTSCFATLTAASSFVCNAGQRLTLTAPGTVSGANIAISVAYTR